MAKRYNRRPSEILGIDGDYEAFCFDEAALYLESEVTDKKGNINWNRIRWNRDRKRNNEDLVKFMQRHG